MDKFQLKTVNAFYREYGSANLPADVQLPGNQYYRVISHKNIDIRGPSISLPNVRDNIFFLAETTTIHIEVTPTSPSSSDAWYVLIIGFINLQSHDAAFRSIAYSPAVITWPGLQGFATVSTGTHVKPGHNKNHLMLLYEMNFLRVDTNNIETQLPTNRIVEVAVYTPGFDQIHNLHSFESHHETPPTTEHQKPVFLWQAKFPQQALIIADDTQFRVLGDVNPAATYLQATFHYGSI